MLIAPEGRPGLREAHERRVGMLGRVGKQLPIRRIGGGIVPGRIGGLGLQNQGRCAQIGRRRRQGDLPTVRGGLRELAKLEVRLREPESCVLCHLAGPGGSAGELVLGARLVDVSVEPTTVPLAQKHPGASRRIEIAGQQLLCEHLRIRTTTRGDHGIEQPELDGRRQLRLALRELSGSVACPVDVAGPEQGQRESRVPPVALIGAVPTAEPLHLAQPGRAGRVFPAGQQPPAEPELPCFEQRMRTGSDEATKLGRGAIVLSDSSKGVAVPEGRVARERRWQGPRHGLTPRFLRLLVSAQLVRGHREPEKPVDVQRAGWPRRQEPREGLTRTSRVTQSQGRPAAAL